MAGHIDAGALRTKITVFVQPSEPMRDTDGYLIKGLINVFGENKYRHCKWVNAHGNEVYEAKRAGVAEPATLTMRYTPKITPACQIFRMGDDNPYEVISINDVENRHAWLEIKVQRKVAAK